MQCFVNSCFCSRNFTSVVRFPQTFTDEQEQALALYLTEMETKLFGLDGTEVRRLAYEYAEKLQIPHKFNYK